MDARTTVLVIEDSPVVQHLLRATLTPMGFDLHFAFDGEEGLDLARRHVPDVITLDIGLPGIDGWQVLTELRASPDTSQISVLVLTAHAQTSVEQAASDRGADSFLTKPFRPADLRVAVDSLVSRVPAAAVAGF
jgi:putative two-component system response regulator